MTSEEIRAFLTHGTRTAKLATSGANGQPHVMPVWFALDGEELVFTTWGDSVKGRNLRRDPRVAIVVDDEVAPYAFVHIRGHVDEEGKALDDSERRHVRKSSSRTIRWLYDSSYAASTAQC